ncbi:hypothetical protein EF72_21395 [Salmonella enterica]|nr:hypothetical protein [Salmonella enterica]
MKTKYSPRPSEGDLLMKSWSAIEFLQQEAQETGVEFHQLCKSLVPADIKKPKAAPKAETVISDLQKSIDLMKANQFGCNSEQVHQKHLAEAEMRKCIARMKTLGKSAQEIVQFQQATEAALNHPGIDNGVMIKSLTQLLNS